MVGKSEIKARLRLPIVMIHGLGARANYGKLEYFHGIVPRLRAAGNEVLVASIPFWHSIHCRAERLKEQIEKAFPRGQKVNLLGHSLGGVDARYLTSALGFSDRVASVTTVGTANRGTVLADLGLFAIPERALSAIDRLAAPMFSNDGFRQTSRQFCEGELEKLAPDVRGVAYFSATSVITGNPLRTALPIFWVPHRILKFYEGDNDGFVSLRSAKWGEHICTFEGDHYAQIGQLFGRTRGMDHIAFFETIFARLAKAGF